MNHADQTFCQLLDKTVNLGIGCVKVRKLDHDRGDVSFRGAVDDALDVIDRAPAAQLEQGGKLTRNNDPDIRERGKLLPRQRFRNPQNVRRFPLDDPLAQKIAVSFCNRFPVNPQQLGQLPDGRQTGIRPGGHALEQPQQLFLQLDKQQFRLSVIQPDLRVVQFLFHLTRYFFTGFDSIFVVNYTKKSGKCNMRRKKI